MANSDDTTNNNKWFFHPSDREQNINRTPLHATPIQMLTAPFISKPPTTGQSDCKMPTKSRMQSPEKGVSIRPPQRTDRMGTVLSTLAPRTLQYRQSATKQITVVRCNQMTTLQSWRILQPMRSTPGEQETQTSGSEDHLNHSNSPTSGIPDHV
jgi:hypothetical protein